MPTYLQRYLNGEHYAVWADLVALGPAVRDEPLASDAHAVAQEMMRRARHNIELIVPRLRDINYRFKNDLSPPTFDAQKIIDHVFTEVRRNQLNHPDEVNIADLFEQTPDLFPGFLSGMADSMQKATDTFIATSGQAEWEYQAAVYTDEPSASSAPPSLPGRGAVWRQPDDYVRSRVEYMEQRFGSLPIVIREWFMTVGEVDLSGIHPHLSRYWGHAPDDEQGPHGDPLVFQCWGVEEIDEEDEELLAPPYAFEFSPDDDLKSNYSGSGGAWIEVPEPAFDTLLNGLNVFHLTHFIPYLRLCFKWGGFPGLHRELAAQEQARETLNVLTKDLLPL